jgi:hypothetical protein
VKFNKVIFPLFIEENTRIFWVSPPSAGIATGRRAPFYSRQTTEKPFP